MNKGLYLSSDIFCQSFSFDLILNNLFGFLKIHFYSMIIIKMEIPNYDGDTKNKKFRQRYSFMPNDTFRMLMCRNSGSGKTNLLYHMLIEPLLYYDEIYLYAKKSRSRKISKFDE